MVRFGARDYDPATGKWTAKDPIDFAGGDLNLLSYTSQDSVNWVDPEGFSGLLIGMEPILMSGEPFLFGRGPYVNIPRNLRGPVRNIPQEPLPRIRPCPKSNPRWVQKPIPEYVPKSRWARILKELADWLDELGIGGGAGGLDAEFNNSSQNPGNFPFYGNPQQPYHPKYNPIGYI